MCRQSYSHGSLGSRDELTATWGALSNRESRTAYVPLPTPGGPRKTIVRGRVRAIIGIAAGSRSLFTARASSHNPFCVPVTQPCAHLAYHPSGQAATFHFCHIRPPARCAQNWLTALLPGSQTGIDAVRYSLGMTSGVVGTGVFSFMTLGQPEQTRLPPDPSRGSKEGDACKECAGGKDQKQECSSEEASGR
eukprot:scaffold18435_cov113-Isochrysis_galbana.AAC.4